MKKLMSILSALVVVSCMIQCTSNRAVEMSKEERAQTIDVLMKHGLNGLKVNYDMEDLESMDSDGMYTYLDALDLALESYLTDGSFPESPLALVPNTMDSYVGNESRPQQHLNKLVQLINLGGSLCMPDIDGSAESCSHAEEGEGIEKNWIFLLQIPELSEHHFWAIVPKDGKEQVYNYGFN